VTRIGPAYPGAGEREEAIRVSFITACDCGAGKIPGVIEVMEVVSPERANVEEAPIRIVEGFSLFEESKLTVEQLSSPSRNVTTLSDDQPFHNRAKKLGSKLCWRSGDPRR
jgi:hypothetical protein